MTPGKSALSDSVYVTDIMLDAFANGRDTTKSTWQFMLGWKWQSMPGEPCLKIK